MRKSTFFGMVLLITALSASLAFAQAQGKGKGKNKKEKAAVSDTGNEGGLRVEVTFSVEERRIIVDWFSDDANRSGLPPGLAKREDLPPGLQRQLVRNGTLPPGLEKKLTPLPADLSRRLSSVPSGTRQVLLAGSVIWLDEKTRRILDLVENVVGATR